MSPVDTSDVLRSEGLARSLNGDGPSAAMCFAKSVRFRRPGRHAEALVPPDVVSDPDGGLSPGCDRVDQNGL